MTRRDFQESATECDFREAKTLLINENKEGAYLPDGTGCPTRLKGVKIAKNTNL